MGNPFELDLELGISNTGSRTVVATTPAKWYIFKQPSKHETFSFSEDGSILGFAKKHPWEVTVFAPLLPNILGSIFNVWYNVTNIQPLLSETQLSRFLTVVAVYNTLIYPTMIFFYVRWMLPMRETHRRLLAGEIVSEERLKLDRRKTINSPWAIVTIGCIGWFLCIPVFMTAMYMGPEPVHPHVLLHLPISFLIAGMIAISQSFFLSEISSLKLLHPLFFPDGGASSVEGAYSMSIARKGLIWAVSVIVCPVVSLLLLIIAPQNVEWIIQFATSVGLVTIFFGLGSAWLMAQLVTEPVQQLRHAAEQVGSGNLDVKVNLSRADDFGPLIDEFNQMVSGLKERTRIQETFGRHVGEAAAKEILQQQSGETGELRDITVMFADLQNFTALGSDLAAAKVVQILNLFFTEMVEIVERHDGMVNKFLGDGFMALFGAIEGESNHAENAVLAAQEMLGAMKKVNSQIASFTDSASRTTELIVRVGLNTGPAIVGSIGSTRRLEYTAIGDTVNIASRIESLTKPLKSPLLISATTRQRLGQQFECRELPAQQVKGKSEPVEIYEVV